MEPFVVFYLKDREIYASSINVSIQYLSHKRIKYPLYVIKQSVLYNIVY